MVTGLTLANINFKNEKNQSYMCTYTNLNRSRKKLETIQNNVCSKWEPSLSATSRRNTILGGFNCGSQLRPSADSYRWHWGTASVSDVCMYINKHLLWSNYLDPTTSFILRLKRQSALVPVLAIPIWGAQTRAKLVVGSEQIVSSRCLLI